jgi:hypothetical protein
MVLRNGFQVELPAGNTTSIRARGRKLTITLLALAALSFLFQARTLEKAPRACLWLLFTGLPCPFCGLCRSLCAFAHGYLSLSVDYNPFGPLIYVSGIFLLIGSAYSWATNRKLRVAERFGIKTSRIVWSVGAIWLIWWLARLYLLLTLK